MAAGIPTVTANSPAQGAYTDLQQLIALRHSARDLRPRAHQMSRSPLAGSRATRFRGRGMEFEEVRQYQPGDDIRSIDWQVTARTGRPHTKLFREERERPLLLAVDQRPGMFFGSQHCFKSVLAGHLAALIGWAGLNQGDRVGGLVFNDTRHGEVRPRRHRHAVLRLLRLVDDFNHQLSADQTNQGQHGHTLADLFRELLRISHPGHALFLISDLQGLDDAAEKCLYQLARRCDIVCLQPYDALEVELPAGGNLSVSDGQRRMRLAAGDPRLREHYTQSFEQRLAANRRLLGRLGIPLWLAATHEPPLALLQRHWGGRR